MALVSLGFSFLITVHNFQEGKERRNRETGRTALVKSCLANEKKERKRERQADTKDLTSSSKVLRVLGPNLTDAISFSVFSFS